MIDDLKKYVEEIQARKEREAAEPITLEAIKARLSRTWPGPWSQCRADGDGCSCGLVFSESADSPILTVLSGNEEEGVTYKKEKIRATAAFVAHSVSDVAWLLKRVETLEAQLKKKPRRISPTGPK